jgi:hypothetical protein
MKSVALSCVLLICAVAGAQPAPRKPMKECMARGTPIFEIDRRVDPGTKMPTSTFKLYDTGAWTFDTADAEGKAAEPKRGCIAGDDLAKTKDDLKVDWKVSNAKFHCMAFSPQFTEFSVNGKIVYTARLCNGQTLDEASTKALGDLQARVKTLTGE